MARWTVNKWGGKGWANDDEVDPFGPPAYRKQTGYTGSIPDSQGNLGFKRAQKEALGNLFITKMSQQDKDGNMIIVKGHGRYQKFIYDQATAAPFSAPVSLDVDPSLYPGNYLAFYRESGKTKMAYLNIGTSGIQKGMFSSSGAGTMGTSGTLGICTTESLGMYTTSGTSGSSANITDKVFCHAKRFNHNVRMVSGSAGTRELYLFCSSFKMAIYPVYFPGWIAFMAANPTFPLVTNTANTRLIMTSTVGADLITVNSRVNGEHEKVYDGGLDNWEIMGTGDSGDCEDFALTKANVLLGMGYPASAMRLAAGKTVAGTNGAGWVYPTTGIGHAWLVVQTDEGDYALDVWSNDVVLENQLNYSDRQWQTGRFWKVCDVRDCFKNAVHTGYNSNYEPNIRWYIFDPLINKFTTIFDGNSYFPYDQSKVEGGQMRELVINVCNFSEDNNTIYISSGIRNGALETVTSYIYSIKYVETMAGILSYSVLRGPISIPGANWPIYVDRSGNFYYVNKDNYNLESYNIDTGGKCAS
jgi:predicted transglutaminase-like cysteine proteinase